MQNTIKEYKYQEDRLNLNLKDSIAIGFDYRFVNDNNIGFQISREEAKIFLSLTQKVFLSLLFIGMSYCTFFFPINTIFSFMIVVNILYLLILSLRFYIIILSPRAKHKSIYHLNIPMLEWPEYTILVPLHREERVLTQLIKNLENIDYPESKLEVLLVLEQTDQITRDALEMLELKAHFKKIIVPYSYPQTKPKACNFALRYVSGKYLTIYDAEDKPDILQLKKALAYFGKHSDGVCQASLSYYNGCDNWLTQMFSLEYAILFERILPAFQLLNLPITLGGSSNHFCVKTLKEIGGWDSYNVTEDADLGIRLAQNKCRVEMLHSETEEESPVTIKAWLAQRARWIKGFIQTYFVHMRSPKKLYNSLGLKGFIAFNLLFGVTNFLHIMLPVILVASFFINFGMVRLSPLQLQLTQYFVYSSLFFGLFTLVWSAYEVRNSSQKLQKIRCWYIYPLYLLLLSIASIMALHQIITKLHFWQKTEHGMTILK